MAEIQIPRRPSNDGEYGMIKANDRDCICYHVAFNVPNERAFALFHPEFLDESGKLSKAGKQQCRQFFSYAKNKEYADSYRTDLEKILSRNSSVQTKEELTESRTDRVIQKLIGDVLDSIEDNHNLAPEVLKDFVEVARKLNVLKDEEKVQEKPRRYLPQRCSSCDYRSFVESYVETGEIENSCLRCKALTIAEAQGFSYDPKTILRSTDEKLAE